MFNKNGCAFATDIIFLHTVIALVYDEPNPETYCQTSDIRFTQNIET